MKASINNVESYTIASMTLHNFLHQTDNGYSKDSKEPNLVIWEQDF